jgi:hypothetical protein
LGGGGWGAIKEVVALTRGGLVRLEAANGGAGGEFELPPPLGQDLFLALDTGQGLVAGWPEEADPALTALVRTSLPLAGDFFDDRQVLGVFFDRPNEDLYALVRLWRKGGTSLEAAKAQPWRLGILRWKYDGSAPRLALAGQAYFFRGILAKAQPPPSVRLSPRLWKLRKGPDVWEADGP